MNKVRESKNTKSDRRIIHKELDTLWKTIIYLIYDYRCEMCGKIMTPEECHAHHIISRGNFNTRWDLANGSLLCDYNHNRASNAPHYDNNKYLEWLKDHRWKGHYDKLLKKSGEKGGANKLEILELMQLRDQLKEVKRNWEKKRNSKQSIYIERYYCLKMK